MIGVPETTSIEASARPITAPKAGNARQQERRRAVIGFVLMAAYLLQALLQVEWPVLSALQPHPVYRMVTGTLLLAYITHQWWVTWVRMTVNGNPARHLRVRHAHMGYLSPIILFIHSTTLGFGYLALLSGIFLANLGVGLINPSVYKTRSPGYTFQWIMVHTMLAVLVTALVFFHLHVVFTFH